MAKGKRKKVIVKGETRERAAAQQYVPPVKVIEDMVREKFGLKKWKRRSEPKRVQCPVEGYEDNYVVLPAEWTGKHLIKRDEIVEGMKGSGFEDSEDMRKLAISLGLAEEINIPSLGDEPEDWDIGDVPLPVLSWLISAVFGDFLAATFVPKAE